MGVIGSGGIVYIPLPEGGTAGQVLAKVDSDNYDATWVDPSGGGGGGGVAVSAAGSSVNAGTVVFSNSNGVQFGMNGSTVTASVAGAGAAGSLAVPGQTIVLGQAVLSNSNNVTFGIAGSTVTASASFPAQTVQTQNMVSVLGSTGNISFGNANGVTFGGNASTVTASVAAQSVQTQNSVQVQGSSGQISFGNANGVTFGFNASTITASHDGLTSQSNQAFSANGGSSAFQTMAFRDANGITWSNSNGSIQASYSVPAVPPETPFGVSAGTQSVSTGTLQFADSNGISFGMEGSTRITASYTVPNVPAQTNQTVGLYAVSNTTQSSTGTQDARSLSFAGAGIASVGVTNGTVVISVPPAGGAGDGYNILAAGTQTATTAGSVLFENSNGVSFGMSGSTRITASYTVPSVTDYFSRTNTTFNGANISGSMTLNTNGLQMSLSVAPGGGGADGYNILAAGTQTAATNTTVAFANSNGISFGMSGSSQITASYTVPTVPTAYVSSVNGSSGAISLNVGSSLSASTNGSSITFGLASNITTALQSAGAYLTTAAQSNQVINSLNGSTGQISLNVGSSLSASTNGSSITFGLASNITTALQSANAGYLTSQSNQAVSGQNGSSTFQTLSFGNANGISFGTAVGGVTASHNGLTTARASNDGIGTNTAQTNVTWTVNSNGLSLNAAGYAGTATAITGAALITLNSNGLSFNGSSLAGIGTTFNGTNVSGSMTLNTAGLRLDLSAAAGGGGGGTLSVYAQSNTTQSSSGTIPASSLQFAGAGIASVGVTNGSVLISVPSGGGAGDGMLSFGMSNLGNTAGTSGTVSSGRAVIVGSGVVSLSQSVNGQSLTLSVLAPDTMSLAVAGALTSASAGSTITLGVAQRTLSGYSPYPDNEFIASTAGQATLAIEPEQFPNVQFDRLVLPLFNTNSSNSSGSHTLSFWHGIYSRNVSTLSLMHSTSATTAITHSGTVGSYSWFSGFRLLTIPWTTTLTEGDYWVAQVSRTTSGGANGSYSQALLSNLASNFLGIFGTSADTTQQFTLGQGVYTATTSGLPASIAFSQIRGSDSRALRSPVFMYASGTV